MTNWLILLGLALLSPTVEVGGIVAVGTPFLVLGSYFRGLQLYQRTFQMSFGIRGLCATVYLLCILLSLLWAPQPQVAGFRVAYQLVGYVLFLSMLQRQGNQTDNSRFQFWVVALTCGGLATSVHFLLLMASLTLQGRLGEAFADRITGGVMSLQWGASNTIASALLAPLFAAMLLPSRLAWLRRIAAAAMLLSILCTLSRNSCMCILLALVLYACFSGRAVNTLGAIIGIGIVVTPAVLMLDADVYHAVISTRLEGGDAATFNGRTDCWLAAWDGIERNWPCPVGFYGSLPTLGHSAHNLILTDLYELGVWGLLAHLAFFAAVIAGLCIARRHQSSHSSHELNVLLAGVIAIFVNLQFEDPQYTQPYMICSWIFMGLCVAATRRPNNTTSTDGMTRHSIARPHLNSPHSTRRIPTPIRRIQR